MIDAELCGKVPKHENKEDVLTSNVFGLLGLINNKYLLEIIKKSGSKDINKKSMEDILNGRKIESLELWRRFDNNEPDIFVTLDNKTSFVIEVKYFGGEHNSKEKVVLEEEEHYIEKGQLKKYLEVTNTSFIIYLTASYLSMKELSEDSLSVSSQIYHLHWKDFNKYLKEFGASGNECEKKVISKITEYLDYKGFEAWEGFKYQEKYNIDTKTGGFYERK